MCDGRRSAIRKFTCYYWACVLARRQRVSFYQPIGGWFWNCPRMSVRAEMQFRDLVCSRMSLYTSSEMPVLLIYIFLNWLIDFINFSRIRNEINLTKNVNCTVYVSADVQEKSTTTTGNSGCFVSTPSMIIALLYPQSTATSKGSLDVKVWESSQS
jgi:hypothetical protein